MPSDLFQVLCLQCLHALLTAACNPGSIAKLHRLMFRRPSALLTAASIRVLRRTSNAPRSISS